MTKDKTVTMSRELVQRWVDNTDFFEDLRGKSMTEINEAKKEDEKITEELRSILAAPVVERQPEPSLWLVRIPEEPEDPEESPAEYVHAGSTYELSNLLKRPGATIDQVYYASPPAPVAVVLPERKNSNDIWPSPNLTTAEHIADTWNACLDKVKELNQ